MGGVVSIVVRSKKGFITPVFFEPGGEHSATTIGKTTVMNVKNHVMTIANIFAR